MTPLTALPAPAIPKSRIASLRWIVADAGVLLRRNLVHWTRKPFVLVYSLFWPIMVVLIFGFIFGSAMKVPGGGDYRQFLMPGLFGQTMLFGAVTTLTIVTNDVARGVTDRFRSMPMSSAAVVLGRNFADMFHSAVELFLLVLCGLAIGWRWHHGPAQALAAFGLLLLLRFSLIWVGIYMGLLVPQEAAGAAFIPLYPISLLANTFVSPSQMPVWLRVIAEWNPLSATVGACGRLFGNPGRAGGSWPAHHSLLLAIAWPLLIIVVFMPLSVRRWRNLGG
ncbi:ABC transporter permease [Streptomyces glomeratus]|uniref:Transport permease protein n=1 Tax=Streptomyces glomeratus TaxID=284452 RepID=A0ABP6LLR7_9ACTN|nr:ABC transporter permease [Streptomyces glomeratus]